MGNYWELATYFALSDALASGDIWVPTSRLHRSLDVLLCHHTLEDYLDAYLDGCALRGDPKGSLFRTIERGRGVLSASPLPQANAYAMIGRRATAADIATKIGNHTFRATGITPLGVDLGGQVRLQSHRFRGDVYGGRGPRRSPTRLHCGR